MLVDRYEVYHRLGYGGMSTVHLGRDTTLKREVAIKILHPGLAEDKNARVRFEREAEAVARLRHPGILEVYDYAVSEDGEPFIVMEYVDGQHLAAFIKDRPTIIPEAIARIATTMARGLQAAHEARVIHRDFKPENVMVARDGRVLLTDFGIAHVMGLTKLTLTGSLVGSPAHMAPEILEGIEAGPSADIFAIGTVVYGMLTGGKLPFSGKTPHEVLKRVYEGTYTDVRTHAPLVGQEMAAFIDRCMARDPKDRFPSASATADALNVLSGEIVPETSTLVRALFETPEETSKELISGLQTSLEKTLAEARKKRQAGVIAETTNRLLALDCDHEDAKAALNELSRYDSANRWFKMLAAILFLLTGAVAAHFMLAPPVEESPAVSIEERPERLEPETFLSFARRGNAGALLVSAPGTPEIKPEKRVAVKSEKASPRASRTTRAQPRTNKRKAATPSKANAPTKPRRDLAREKNKPKAALIPVQIFAFPPAAKILVDGKFRAFGRVENLMLKAGRHKVELHHPECKACAVTKYEFTLDASRPPNRPFRFQIKYLPASLEVKSSAPGKVFLDDKYVGSTGSPLKVVINDARGRRLRVKVVSRDKVYKPQGIRLKPGESKTLIFKE